MSDSKHTPGPWTLEKSGDGKWIFIESDQNKDNWNCLRCEVDSDDCDSEMAMANAKLIAAAPELLEAVKAAKKYLEPDLVEPGRTVFWNLVAAIKKAEGK